MGSGREWARWRAPAAVVLLGVVAYWPALNNPFVADDYAFFWYVDRLQGHWTDLALHPLGLRRVVSTLFFALCYQLFGFAPAGYYAANLLLHLLISGLVGVLVGALSRERTAGAAAALFFVAYERHQEAVFWITAHHELFVSLGVLATVWFFWRYRTQGRWRDYGLALGALGFSALSKESFIVVAPLLVWLEVCFFGWRGWRRWVAYAPFVLGVAAYAAQMYSVRQEVPLYALYYGITPHFFVAFGKTVARLLVFVLVFLLLAWWVGRRAGEGTLKWLREEKAVWFFFGWLLIAPIPYSFLLYLDQLPSRQTYLPSVATAALVGLLFERAAQLAGSTRLRYAPAALLAVILTGNVLYVWKKDTDYLHRAAPTGELIVLLNRQTGSEPIAIYGFPYEHFIGEAAVRYFAPRHLEQVRFLKPGQAAPEGSRVLHWNDERENYEILSPGTK